MKVLKVGDKVVSVNNQLLSAPNGGGGYLALMGKLVTLYLQQQTLALYRQPDSQS